LGEPVVSELIKAKVGRGDGLQSTLSLKSLKLLSPKGELGILDQHVLGNLFPHALGVSEVTPTPSARTSCSPVGRAGRQAAHSYHGSLIVLESWSKPSDAWASALTGAILGPQSHRTAQEPQAWQDTMRTRRARNEAHNMGKAARASL